MGHLWPIGLAGSSESCWQIDKGLKKKKFLVITRTSFFNLEQRVSIRGLF